VNAPKAVGVIGVGHLASHLVPRLARDASRRIVLSPRNRTRAEALAQSHANVAVARDNAALNGWAHRFEVVEGDITDRNLLTDIPSTRDGFDEVLCNPPHHPAEMTAAPDRAKATATREDGATLEDWVEAALAHVRRKGAVTFVHRAERLDDLLATLRGRAGGVIVFPLWPKSGQAARRVLVRARKDVRAPLTLAAGLVLHTDDGRFTPEAERVLREGYGLAF